MNSNLSSMESTIWKIVPGTTGVCTMRRGFTYCGPWSVPSSILDGLSIKSYPLERCVIGRLKLTGCQLGRVELISAELISLFGVLEAGKEISSLPALWKFHENEVLPRSVNWICTQGDPSSHEIISLLILTYGSSRRVGFLPASNVDDPSPDVGQSLAI